jgi:hypothetical protein
MALPSLTGGGRSVGIVRSRTEAMELFYGIDNYQSQWLRGLRRRSTAARLLRRWVRTPPRTWKFVCCVCYVLSNRGWGTVLQAGRSRVRFPKVSLEFFIDKFLPAALWPWTRLNFYQKWVTPWPQSASELYRQNGRRRSAKVVPTVSG